jgi:hypothetical protein
MSRKFLAWFLILFLYGRGVEAQTRKALFDNTKNETAGNADWIIDTNQPVPSPAQSTVTSTTDESYWLGAISAWGIDLVRQGFTVHTLTTTYGITFNNSSNPYDLSNYDVFIVCEPQNQFTAAEKSAIISYVQNGGGLIMVADHYASDRDNDGWDSPEVWNDLKADSLFGIHFQVSAESNNNITEVSTNRSTSPTDSIIFGLAGTATSISYHNGTTMRLLTARNSNAAGHIWMNSASQGIQQIVVATSRYGAGKIGAVGDSSPADDGTGQSGNSLYGGWTESGATDDITFLNLTIWAATHGSASPSISITTPNGGEGWAIGSTQTIQWTSSNVTGNVKIDLSTDGGATFPTVLAPNTANDGSESWTVAGNATSTARIRISSVSNSAVRDSSAANFSILQPAITVTSPNGGESWQIGSTQTITWTSSNLTGTVKIDLSTDGGVSYPTVIAAGTANDGSEPWTVAGPVTAQARVRVSSVVLPTVLDASNANLSIVQPSITLTSPNGGENWVIGSTQSMTWTSANLTGNVKLELSTDGGATYPTVIASSTANDGIESWVVSGQAGSTARTRVTSVSLPSVQDASDANFTLLQPTVTVTSPNGGESWIAGSAQTVQWSSSNLSGNVNIDLSTDGGTSFPIVVASNTPNDGSEAWTVSAVGTTTARVRVSSVSTGSVSDASNTNFTIIQPSITVTAPNGGESWGVGGTHMISWVSTAVTGTVTVQLSRDGGTTFETIAAGIANSGTLPWVVTGPATANANIRITSVDNPAIYDLSNSTFEVTVGFDFLTRLYLHDTGTDLDSLDYGSAIGATDGMDVQFGEYELPPLPPAGIFDLRWHCTGLQGLDRDVRDTLGGTRTQCTYSGTFQSGLAGYPVTLFWHRSELPAGSFTLRDNVGGTEFVVDMKQTDSVVIANPDVTGFQILHSLGSTATANVDAQWNILSIPVTIADRRTSSLFPTASPQAFAYSPTGYVVRDTLQYGSGYWVKFPSAQTVSLTGAQRSVDTVSVTQGWNMIGSITSSVSVTSIGQVPAGIVASSYYAFGSAGFVPATAILPLRGYWVKVNQNGKLILR